ncbi:MAG: hypothetical protein LBU21_00405, partial [Treponema sp.]|nr:hypothetical protein [Treponema sp.]
GATDYSVLEGLKLTGRILRVIKGGETVARDGKVLAEKGSGRFIPTEASCPGVEILPAMNR